MNTANNADALVAKGLEASRLNDSASALDFFTQASNAAPGSGVPHFLIGSEYASLGEMDKAEAAFANAVLVAPDLAIARYQLGLLQFSSARAAVALLTWQPLLALPDADPLPHFVRGFAELAQDRFDEALHHYGKGLERNTSNPALSGDIQKVIDGIDALRRNAGAPSAAPRNPYAQPDESASEAHVLLSNYQQQGLPH